MLPWCPPLRERAGLRRANRPRAVQRIVLRRGRRYIGRTPHFDTPLRLSEFVATLALAQDNAFGQPLESQLRSCLLATSICEAAGFDEELRETAYWVALLRYVGCTGHAHEVATVFGDEIAIRAQTLVHDAANPDGGDAGRHGLRDGRPHPGGARRDRQADPGDGARVGGLQLLVRVRGRRHAAAAARLRPRRSRGAALHVRALERERLSRPRAGGGDPARDARRAPQPRHGGDRPPVLAGSRHRGRPRSPRPHLRPGARRPVRRAWARLVRSARRDRAVGRRARPRARAAPHAVRRAARRRPDRRRRLHRPQVAVHGRAQPSLRGARSRRRPGARARRGRRSTRSVARRSCTTSEPPSCRTRSGTSPGRSRARSSIGSSCTRC